MPLKYYQCTAVKDHPCPIVSHVTTGSQPEVRWPGCGKNSEGPESPDSCSVHHRQGYFHLGYKLTTSWVQILVRLFCTSWSRSSCRRPQRRLGGPPGTLRTPPGVSGAAVCSRMWSTVNLSQVYASWSVQRKEMIRSWSTAVLQPLHYWPCGRRWRQGPHGSYTLVCTSSENKPGTAAGWTRPPFWCFCTQSMKLLNTLYHNILFQAPGEL